MKPNVSRIIIKIKLVHRLMNGNVYIYVQYVTSFIIVRDLLILKYK